MVVAVTVVVVVTGVVTVTEGGVTVVVVVRTIGKGTGVHVELITAIVIMKTREIVITILTTKVVEREDTTTKNEDVTVQMTVRIIP